MESFASAAGHHTPAVAAADSKSKFQDRRQDHDTICFVDYVLRNVVRNIHDLRDHGSGLLYPILFLLLGNSL